jgi:hypothetical protein
MSIYKKLLDFQKLGISIRKDKKNPHFKSNYADINEVLDKVKPELSKLGIVLTQMPDIGKSGEGPFLHTILWDTETDKFVDSITPLINATDMQKLGGAITYARRYALVAMLGLEDDDDDGNQASAPAKPSEPQKSPVERLAAAKSLAELQTTWKALTDAQRHDPEAEAMKDEMKAKLSDKE